MQLVPAGQMLAQIDVLAWLGTIGAFIKVIIGFSIIIFFHELGHYLACLWVNVRVHRFAVGFGKRLCGFRKGEGFTFGSRPNYKPAELIEKGYGETDYSLMALPIGGYVKMEDHDFDEETDEIVPSKDPRAFSNRTAGQRLIVLSAGVVFNVLFAAILFILIFLIGRNVPGPVVGETMPGSPAEGLLLPDDRIEQIDGSRINTFADIRMAAMLSDGPLSLVVRRNGALLDKPITVEPLRIERLKISELGLWPALTSKVAVDGVGVPGREAMRAGDDLRRANGHEIHSPFELYGVFQAARGAPVELTVERPADPKKGTPAQTVTCYERASMDWGAADNVPEGYDPGHLLGFIRRPRVKGVTEGFPAKAAGFQAGDSIESWQGIPDPTTREVIETIQRNADKINTVTVEREGRRLELTVKPRRPFKLLGKPENARVGIDFNSPLGDDRPKVARIVPGTPAFEGLGDVRGIVLRSIDGQVVSNWNEVTVALLDAAGKTVAIEFESGGQVGSAKLRVPSSFVNELELADGRHGLPAGARITGVDGENRLRVRGADGVERESGLNSSAIGSALSGKVGKSVTITYRMPGEDAEHSGRFQVSKDAIDPWQLRVRFEPASFGFEVATEPVSAHGNPLVAFQMGYRDLMRTMYQMLQSMAQLASGKVGTDSVAGPIGIVQLGVAQAESGITDLMFFLALLSINLAGINLLPIPILDGGHIVFLLIEKIKGRPLSFNVRFYTAIVGLAAIILIGLFVTIQDIGRWFS